MEEWPSVDEAEGRNRVSKGRAALQIVGAAVGYGRD